LLSLKHEVRIRGREGEVGKDKKRRGGIGKNKRRRGSGGGLWSII